MGWQNSAKKERLNLLRIELVVSQSQVRIQSSQTECQQINRHAKSWEPGNLVPGHFWKKSGQISEIKALKK